MIYKEDFYNIMDAYSSMYANSNKKLVAENEEEFFPDLEDDIVGDIPDEDNDNMGDALETKVYTHLNTVLGEDFRDKCDQIKEKFDLDDNEFCLFFKGWFDKNHAMAHINDQI